MENSQKFLANLVKKYGEEIIKSPKLDVIPSSSLGLNILTGVGGSPRGRILEFYGNEAGGKTTIALDYMANANKLDFKCLYLDIEAALDKKWASQLGVNWELTDYLRPGKGEDAFDIASEACRSNLYSLIVIDSVAALVSEAELEGSLADTKDRVGGFVAKMMSVGLKKLVPLASQSNTGIIFINQVRDKLGVLYGDPEDTPGGRALKFYASVRIRVNKLTAKDTLKMSGDIQIGHRTKCTIKKNKLSAPDSRPAEFNLYYERGIDQLEEIIEWGHKLNILYKRGSIITYNNEKYATDIFEEKIKKSDDFKKEIIDQIMQKSHTPIIKEDDKDESN